MILALNSKNKLGFVNGSIKAPLEEIDPEGYATWSRCNDMVHSWIVNTLNLEIADSQLSVSAYYTKLKGLWDELASYNAAAHGAQQDQQKLMQFLMGLNESYSAIRRQILLMNPLPSCPPSILLSVHNNGKSSATWKDGIDRSNIGMMEPTDRPFEEDDWFG
ncbi:hypothetical protein AAG906_000681 [Vitis piasezkii]